MRTHTTTQPHNRPGFRSLSMNISAPSFHTMLLYLDQRRQNSWLIGSGQLHSTLRGRDCEPFPLVQIPGADVCRTIAAMLAGTCSVAVVPVVAGGYQRWFYVPILEGDAGSTTLVRLLQSERNCRFIKSSSLPSPSPSSPSPSYTPPPSPPTPFILHRRG